MTDTRWIRRGLVAIFGTAALLLGAAPVSAPAQASPGPATEHDGPGCMGLVRGHVCDGPKQGDNAFLRCRMTPPLLVSRGRMLPAQRMCWVVDPGATPPNYGPGMPQEHLLD